MEGFREIDEGGTRIIDGIKNKMITIYHFGILRTSIIDMARVPMLHCTTESMVRTGSSTGIYCNENVLKSIGSVYVIHTNHIKPNVPHIKFGQKRNWGLH